MNTGFNLQSIMELLGSIKPKEPVPVGFVLRPDCYSNFLNDPKILMAKTAFDVFAGALSSGIKLYRKPEQKTPCIAFYDAKLLKAYLDGTISEEHELCQLHGIKPA